MAQKAPKRRRPELDAAPRRDVVQSGTSPRTSGGFATLLESAVQEVLAVTYWFDPAPQSGPPVTVRFSGRRIDARGRLTPGDRFVQDETIEEVVPGSGPISLTARVRGINAGDWAVTARVLESARPAHEKKEPGNATPAPGPLPLVTRFWRSWAPPAASVEPVRTCQAPFARVPGIFPGIWGAMVTLGIVVALVIQSLVIALDQLALGPWWAISLIAIVMGIAGSRVWYTVLHRREHSMNGWCIQGFITGATLTAAVLLLAFGVPAGVFLDVTAPGLLLAMAVGRIGCFFAGCCGGPPTASRWGVWSSDQRVGARRIPTQLLESALAGILGLGALAAVLGRGPAGGAFFAGGLAAYVLVRQGILHLRAEPRKTRLGGPVTAALAALALLASVVLLVL